MMIHAFAGNYRFLRLLIVLMVLVSSAVGAVGSAGDVARVLAETGPTIIESVNDPIEAQPSGPQTLRMVGPAQGLDSLDPAFSRDLSTAFLIRQVFRGLTRLDRDLNPVPELAERIEISADGLTYRFR